VAVHAWHRARQPGHHAVEPAQPDRPVTAPAAGDVRIRPVEPADVPAIVAMVHELAEYERSAAECTLTAEKLAAALFAPHPALFGHVAVAPAAGPADDPAGNPVGFALWFLNYSTWTGTHGIYLEDLYVRPAHRG